MIGKGTRESVKPSVDWKISSQTQEGRGQHQCFWRRPFGDSYRRGGDWSALPYVYHPSDYRWRVAQLYLFRLPMVSDFTPSMSLRTLYRHRILPLCNSPSMTWMGNWSALGRFAASWFREPSLFAKSRWSRGSSMIRLYATLHIGTIHSLIAVV